MQDFWLMLPVGPWGFPVLVGILGLIVGSFLNVVVCRLPRMLERQWQDDCAVFSAQSEATPAVVGPVFNLMVPRSRCPHCEAPIQARDNVPIISFLWLRGRCRHCAKAISMRYPLIESFSGLAGAAVAVHFGPGWTAVFAALLSWSLIALAVIDFDTYTLPDAITLPFLWLGILVNTTGAFVSLKTSVFGAMAGYLSLWSVYWIFKWVTGKEGMGYGDFKLLAMLGAWLGWQVLPTLLISASLVGAITGIGLMVFAGHARDKPIPFGPHLACAGWLMLFWGDRLSALWSSGAITGGSL